MLKLIIYDKELDIDLDEWSNKDYSNYQNDVISLHYLMKLFHKYIIHILKILIKWEVYLIK